MTPADFRNKYKGKQRERYNKAIRAEIQDGGALLELRRYISYLKNVKPLWGDIEQTMEILNSILRQTPVTQPFVQFSQIIKHQLDEIPMAGGIEELRRVLGQLETELGSIRDAMIAEIKSKYNF